MNTRDILRRRAKALAERGSRVEEAPGATMLLFALGSERYALPLRDVAEVRPFDQCTPLPGAREELLGVINVRGDAFSVADLAALLGLERPAERIPGFVLVLRRGERLGLRVDAIIDISTTVDARLVILELDSLLGHPALSGTATAD